MGLNIERYSAASHVVLEVPNAEQPPFERWFVQRHGLSRRIAASCFTFSAMLHLVVGTQYIATAHARLARRLLPSLPLVLLPVPLPIPALKQTMQWHTYRAHDPGLVWLRQLLLQASAAMTADPSLKGSKG